jgi:hypothetical protein
VRLDVADHQVHARSFALARLFEHRVRLADAGGRSEEDLQGTASVPGLFLLDAGEQLVGIGSMLDHGAESAIGTKR